MLEKTIAVDRIEVIENGCSPHRHTAPSTTTSVPDVPKWHGPRSRSATHDPLRRLQTR